MPDDRAVVDTVDQVGQLSRDFEDFKATMLARLGRQPTGDIEPTIRSTPKPDTLICNGQTVSRTTYSALWAWAQANSLVISGLFTTGDGSTTFGLPDFRGRMPIGVGTLGSDTYALGAKGGLSTVTLTIAQMPSHAHFSNTSAEGGHSGHVDSDNVTVGSGTGPGHGHTPHWGWGVGDHTHTISADGGDGPHENRPPYLAINWLIWT